MASTGCRSGGQALQATLPPRPAEELLQELDDRAPEWTTMGIRMESTASAMGRSGSFTLNVRVARDSVIWMSISPALGVEAARILLTPDSVQVLSKLPGARFVFQGNYGMLEEALQSPVSFSMVQDLIMGRPLLMDRNKDTFESLVQAQKHVLLTKYDRKLRKLVGLDGKEMAPDDSLTIVAKEKKAERLIEKVGNGDGLLVKRYWLDGLTYDPVKDVVDDLVNHRSIRVVRSDFEDTEIGRLPSRVRMVATGPEGLFDARIDTKRRRIGRTYDFPFSIPEGFERRTEL
jgi:hypothetical protein